MTRVIGAPRSRRRRWTFMWCLVVLLSVGAFFISGAQAVPGGGSIFELDASLDLSNGAAPKAAVTDNATAGLPDDWDRIAGGTDNALARSFDSETTATGTADQRTIFTTGGSKDQGVLSGWKWKDNAGGLPDKDNLLHAMAARYATASNSYIFFGADRFDNSGDAQIGFWFFKTTVCTNADGTFGNTLDTSGNCSGTAVHSAGLVPHSTTTTGDILILSDFTNGGTQPTIRIFEWVGSGGSDGELNLLGGTTTDVRDCGVVSTDDFCASVNNNDGAVAPWLFKNKSGQSTFGHGEFYEGGLNLNTLGLQNDCFASFLAETRSAQSVTATLKDFVGGGFQQCSSGLVTTPKTGAGGAIPAGGLSIGTGSVTAKDSAALTIGGAANWTGTLTFSLCKTTSPATCTSGGTQISTGTVTNATTQPILSGAATITSAGHYCWRADFTSGTTGVPNASDSSSTECFDVNPVTPTLTTHAGTSPINLDGTTAITDTADLSGTATQPASPIINTTGAVGAAAGGTITFTLYGPNDCTTVAYTSSAIAVSGDGTYPSVASDVSFVPTAAGTYHWKATYSGNSPNTNGTSDNAACDQTREDVVVRQPTAITTRQFVVPQDKAKITFSGSGSLSGNVSFKLYDNATNCTNNTATGLLYDSGAIAISGASGQTASTSNTVRVDANATIAWRVTYTPAAGSNQTGSSSTCTETTAITYAGNDTGISLP